MAAAENAGDENSSEIDENAEEGFSFAGHEDIYEVERILGVTKHEASSRGTPFLKCIFVDKKIPNTGRSSFFYVGTN